MIELTEGILIIIIIIIIQRRCGQVGKAGAEPSADRSPCTKSRSSQHTSRQAGSGPNKLCCPSPRLPAAEAAVSLAVPARS